MRMSGGVEWAVHCGVVLSQASAPVSTQRLAEFHGVSKTYLAKNLQAMSKAGLIHSVEGRDGGYVLTREPSEVSVLEIVQAVDGAEPAFRCTEIRRRGPLPATDENCLEACGIARVMASAEAAWRDVLAQVSLADLAASLDIDTDGEVLPALRSWLGASGNV